MIETGKARAAVAQSPLQTLYSALQAKLSGTTLNLYPGAIAAGSGPLASALQLIADLNTGVSITGATLSPWPATKIVVTGTTSAFAGSPFTITATFTLDGDQKTVVMTLALSAPHVTFPNAPWFSVDAPSVSVTSKPLSGSFAGTIAFTDTTKKPPTVTTAAVTASITPPGANTSRKAVFSTTFNGAAPSIETIYKYVGGFNLSASLPPPLNALTALQLNGVSFTYDFDAKTLTQFTVDLSTTPAQPWNIIGKLSFTTVDVTFTIAGPTGKRSVSWVASPKVTLGAGTIDATLSYPPFAIGGKLDPASVPPSPNQIALADVITFFLPAGITVPISGAIKAFDMKIVPGSGSAKTTYTIATSVTGDWAIPTTSPVFTVTSLGFNIDGTKPKPAGSVKGSITFFAGQPKLTFGLDVSAVYDGVVWTISGKQQPKTTIHVSDIIKSYIGNGWWSSALPDFSIQDFSANVVMGDPGSWLLSATVPTFTLPFDLALSDVTGNFGNTIPGTAFFAQIGGDARWFGVDLSFGFDYAPGKQKYTLTWNQVTASLDNSTGDWIGTIAFTGDETLGGIIETFVSWATGYKYGLAAPWDLLNDISLNGSSLTYNFTQKTVTVTVGVGLDLGFCSIQSIGLTYNTQATGNQSKVKFDLNGTFFWTSDKQLSWDATKPETTKQPPGNGNEYFDLRLLAMGQHVAVKGIQDAKTVQAAIALLAAMPPNSDSDPSSSGQQYLPPVEYDAGSDWLIGTDIGLLKLPDGDPSGASYAFTLQVLFDDPKFYALRIALDGGPAKILGGLDFEIIYRKISDTVGVYQAEITLPTAMRTIQT
ncbi:MAG: LysM domain protein, partial [Candidatus Eremiobacteraeota bacterium]|nr:LysM domain protein [Candidatus Eremiobacteraeota bacterium]